MRMGVIYIYFQRACRILSFLLLLKQVGKTGHQVFGHFVIGPGGHKRFTKNVTYDPLDACHEYGFLMSVSSLIQSLERNLRLEVISSRISSRALFTRELFFLYTHTHHMPVLPRE